MRLTPQVRPGYLLAEGLVVLALSVLVGAALCTALITQGRLARAVAQRIAHNAAARFTLHVLPAELRYADPATDVRVAAADSIAGRWVRSTGVVCDVQGTVAWLRLRGIRAPDATKDSLLLVGDAGEIVVRPLTWAADDAHCATQPGERVYRTSTASAVPRAAVALIFESGTYYLSQRALRYRLGGEGRQPLTEEFLRDAGSGIALIPSGSMFAATFRLTIELRPPMHLSATRTEVITVVLPNGPAAS